MKKRLSTIILVLFFAAGLCLLLYPSLSNYVNSLHQTRAIQNYTKAVSNIEAEEYQKILNEARDYNDWLLESNAGLKLPDEYMDRYLSTLDVTGTGVMGYIEIESIGVSLPIYHGANKDTLQEAVGHIDGSSLPVGGEGSHCVLSGHRGLPSAKLFTRLDELAPGDLFVLRTLNETLTYQVDKVQTVLPAETSDLLPVPGEDYCTLVTCTPYGINSHRLLVRGTRIDNQREKRAIFVVNEAVQIDPMITAPVFAAPILLVLLILLLVKTKKKKTKEPSKKAKKSKKTKASRKSKKTGKTEPSTSDSDEAFGNDTENDLSEPDPPEQADDVESEMDENTKQ